MHPNTSLCGTATVGTKGQIVIPAEARERLGIRPGDKVFIVCAGLNGDMLGVCTEKSMRGFMKHMSDKLQAMQHIVEPADSEKRKGSNAS